MEASGDGVMSVQRIRKWCREFENSGTGIHDTNRISRPSTSRTAVNAGESDWFWASDWQHLVGRRLRNNEEVEMAIRKWL